MSRVDRRGFLKRCGAYCAVMSYVLFGGEELAYAEAQRCMPFFAQKGKTAGCNYGTGTVQCRIGYFSCADVYSPSLNIELQCPDCTFYPPEVCPSKCVQAAGVACNNGQCYCWEYQY